MATKSIFAQSLHALMVGTEIGSLETWGYVLEIKPSVIEGWLTDKAFPTAQVLQNILTAINRTVAKNHTQYRHFLDLMDQPLATLTNLAPKEYSTLAEYLAPHQH